MENFLKQMFASAPILIKGQTGWYFKFAIAKSSNGEPVELFFKPKFIQAPYLVAGNNLTVIDWLELNILVIGEELPDLPEPWKPLRLGKYKRHTGDIVNGVLIGKMFIPMGEFNWNISVMHEHVLSLCPTIEKYLTDTLLSKTSGSITHPLKMLFEYMPETLGKGKMIEPTVFLNNQFSDYQKKAYAVKTKYSPPSSDEIENDPS